MPIPYQYIDSGSRKVTDNVDLETETFIGLDMPLRKSELSGSMGYFESTSYQIDAIRENVGNIISTQKGERIFKPNLGINWNGYLFELVTPEMIQRLKDEIRTTIVQHMPTVKVQTINVNDRSNDAEVLLYIQLVVEYKGQNIVVQRRIGSPRA